MVKICKKCGKEFTVTKYPNRKYCSPECNPWIGTSPKYNTCLNCGRKLEKKSNYGPLRRYCGEICRWEAHYNRYPEKYTSKCNHCGKPIPINKYGYLANYCSPECRAADAFYNQERQCPQCGKTFTRRSPGDYCSSRCASIAGANTVAERLLKEKRICKNCGVEYIPTSGHQKYCSRKCGDQKYAAEHLNSVASKRNRYRARKANTKHEKFKVTDVYKRDNWICQICGKPVNKNLRYPHLLSASLDHIVPLSKGGEHTEINVRLAHLRCNISRGNRDFITNDNGKKIFVGRF